MTAFNKKVITPKALSEILESLAEQNVLLSSTDQGHLEVLDAISGKTIGFVDMFQEKFYTVQI